MTSIAGWAREVHLLAIEKGWWDKAKDAEGKFDLDVVRSLIPEKLFMVITEACEIGDAVRKRKPPLYWDLSDVLGRGMNWETTTPEMIAVMSPDNAHFLLRSFGHERLELSNVRLQIGPARKAVRDEISRHHKPEGWAAELADTVIRCLDFGQVLGVDLEEMMFEKHTYNKTREYLHGGKPF
jgi:hypothetical protein